MSEYSERRWVDAHCHLSDSRFAHDIGRVLERARVQGVKAFLQGGVSPDEWNRQLDLCQDHPEILPVLGLHPWWVAGSDEKAFEVAFAALDTLAPEAVALGEMGLDAAKERKTLSTWALQKTAFRSQLALANRLGQPVVLHIVRAHADALDVLNDEPPRFGGIVHSFSDTAVTAGRYLDLGLCLSVSGVVCREGHQSLKEAIAGIPDWALLIETDAPDQSPDGPTDRNEPEKLLKIAREVGRLRDESWEMVLDTSTRNLERILKKRLFA